MPRLNTSKIRDSDTWAEVFWRADGSLKPLDVLDEAMARLHPEELRGELGLPEGAAVE